MAAVAWITPVTQTASDTALTRALADGDLEALGALYDRYGGLAYSVALRVLGDPGRAEDVVQDCFLRLWTNAGRFDPARGSLRTWLTTSVRNRAIDYLRGRGAHERQEREIPAEVHASGPGSDPWTEVSAGLERDMVQDALDSLPPEQRQTVELAYFGGYTQAEVAELVGVPLSTVKGRTRLALEKLHSYLQGRGLASGG
ncbi:MAG: sigma-70 family RNA polymerase sigma factor [Candidatus Dormibacteraeota bacterium]|nr:sigma-70 family RNA polymerase sigma factor [Candidatus Dormibacteraeota bacterium]